MASGGDEVPPGEDRPSTPVFSAEQQEWIERLISSRIQTADVGAPGTSSGNTASAPIPTAPLPPRSAPLPGNRSKRIRDYVVAYHRLASMA